MTSITKSAFMADFVYEQRVVPLSLPFERVFQGLACLEFWDSYGRDINFLRWVLRIYPNPAFAGACREGAEAGERHFAAGFECGGHNFFKRFNHILNLFTCDTDLCGNGFCELYFIHSAKRNEVSDSHRRGDQSK